MFEELKKYRITKEAKAYEVMDHNIMCLVGNGFNIAALDWLYNKDPEMKRIGDEIIRGGKTSYPLFYEYICSKNSITKEFDNNLIFVEMDRKYDEYNKEKDENKKKALENWSNFEEIVHELIFGPEIKPFEMNGDSQLLLSFYKKKFSSKFYECLEAIISFEDPDGTHFFISLSDYCEKIEKDLLQMQREFSVFLNMLLPAEKLVRFDELVSEGQFALNSLKSFSADLKLVAHNESWDPFFSLSMVHHDTYKFLFVDFNYTMLLDNYINLDRNQFKPKAYKSSDNNFEIYPYGYRHHNHPSYYEHDHKKYCKIITQVVHPHGIQDVPRSILFGTEKDEGTGHEQFISDERWRFVKSLWAQDAQKYQTELDNTQLFIIFGMSVSKVDGWWMSQIYRRILSGKDISEDKGYLIPELIIYDYYINERTAKKTFEDFVEACIYLTDTEKKDQEYVKKRTYIITYGDKGRKNTFLGFD